MNLKTRNLRLDLANLPKRLPFGVRVGLSAALLAGLALLTFIIASAAIVFDNMIEEADFVLAERSKSLLQQFRFNPPSPSDLEAEEDSVPLNAELSAVKLIRYSSPEIDWFTRDRRWKQKPWRKEGWRNDRKHTVWSWNGLDVWRTYRADAEGRRILLAMDLSEIRREVWRMCKTFLTALPITLIIIAFGGWWMARRSTVPLQHLATAMEHVAQGDLTERVELSHARDLLDRLARVFNRMTGRLQTSFEQATRFSSDASHELRTPLTILRGQLENALQKAEGDQAVQLAELLAQTERLRGIIHGLLLLSRSDAGKLAIGRDEVDFSEIVREVAGDFESALSEAGIALETRIAPNLRVQGDAGLLRQAVVNLLSNAEKFNLPQNGRISVKLARDDGEIRLSVENAGEPIPSHDAQRVFRRFYRTSSKRETPSAPGTGLGLSIVEAVTEAHGGRAWCEPQTDSNRFNLAFPGREAAG